MIYSGNTNHIIITILLFAFCLATALSSDATVGLRGSSDEISHQNGRQLANERVSVYRCDSENRTITSTISNKTEELEEYGLDIRICFRVSNQAISNDLYILKIDDFAFTKDRTNGDLAAAGPTRQIPVIMRQSAVDHGVPMSEDLTEIYCDPGSEICAIETRLTGYFFLTNGIIRGKGSIMMQRGKSERRDLQDMENFEDLYIELDFTGGGRNPMPKKTRIIIIVGVILFLLLLLCCIAVICCLTGICCFAGWKRKNEDTDDDNVEEVSVKIEWDPAAKKSKKGDAEDMSETESLEDDKYWDDDVDISDDENESYGDNWERDGVAVVPQQRTEESSSGKESKKKGKSSKYDFGDDDWHGDDGPEQNDDIVEKSIENSNTEIETENAATVEESEDVPPKKKKSKKKKKKKSKRNSESMTEEHISEDIQ